MRYNEELDTTDSPRVWARAWKRYLEGCGRIKCSYCRYHRGENVNKPGRSWKRSRKKRYHAVNNI